MAPAENKNEWRAAMDGHARKGHVPIEQVLAIASALLIVALFQASLIVFDVSPVWYGGGFDSYWDPDSYTRLLRVRYLHETGEWYSAWLPHINAPEGLELHWTRLLDILLLVPAWLGTAVTDFDTALHYVSFLIAPALQLAGVAALYWALRRDASPYLFPLAVVAFVLPRPVGQTLAIGQADHHGLIVVLLLVTLALLARGLESARPKRLALCAGVAGGLALWVTPEGLLVVAVAAAFLGLAWVGRGRGHLDGLLAYCAGLSSTALVALAIERAPGDWLAVDYLRFSSVHAALALVLLSVCLVLKVLERRSLTETAARRLLSGSGLAGAAGLALVLVFPFIVRSPYALLDPDVVTIMKDTSALRSPLPTSAVEALEFASDFGPVVVAIAFSLIAAVRGSGPKRWRYVLFLVALCISVPYGLSYRRGLTFAGSAAVIPWAEALMALLLWLRSSFGRQDLGRAAAAASLILGVVAASWATGYSVVAASDIKFGMAPLCRYSDIAPFIRGLEDDDTARIIFTDLNSGPEVAYRTGYTAITGTYDNLSGIRSAARIYVSSGHDLEAREIAERRNIRLFLFCRKLPRQDVMMVHRHREYLFTRLMLGQPPPWLRPIELPEDLARRFRLYRRVP